MRQVQRPLLSSAAAEADGRLPIFLVLPCAYTELMATDMFWFQLDVDAGVASALFASVTI
jgi:hypothetical protein